MIIREVSGAHRELYDKCAQEHGTIFNSLAWLAIFGDKVQVYGIYNKGNNLIGGFTVYKERKFGLSIYRNPPFTPAIGPFLKVEANNPVSIMDTWKEVLSLMADFLDLLPYSIITFSLNLNVTDTQPFIWKKFKVIPGYTYLIDLTQPIDDIWSRLSKVRRNEIKKTESDGLVARQIYDYEIIKKLVLKTFSRQKKEIDEYYLDKILFEFANNNNSYAFVTYMDTLPIAGTFCVFHKNIAYALVGGYDNAKKHRGAGPLADWKCIKHAKELGLKTFDFEGSMIQPIEKYMRGFGGILTPYYTINKAKLPIEILLKFVRRERF